MSRTGQARSPPAAGGHRQGIQQPCSVFTRWQTGHVRIKGSMSEAIFGHQTMRRAKAMVFSRPKCPPRGVACSSVSTSRRSSGSEGMHKRSPLALRRNRRPARHKYEGCIGVVVKGTGCPRLSTRPPASGRAAAARGPRTAFGIVIDSGSEGLRERLVNEAWGVQPRVPAMDKHLASNAPDPAPWGSACE